MSNPGLGWYNDPGNPAQQRWWDGEAWSQHIRPLATQRSSYPTASGAAPTTTGNSVASTGFGLGIAALFLFSIPIFGLLLSLAAAIVSGAGLAQQRPTTAKKYRVLAIIGLVLGIIYTLMALLFLATGR
jgi:hypothetical protein